MKLAFVLFLSVALAIFGAPYAVAAPLRLVVQSRQIQPDEEQLKQWLENFWVSTPEGQEIWAFRNESDAEDIFRSSEIPFLLQQQLLASHRSLTEEQIMRFGWQHTYRARHLLILTPWLRDQIPQTLSQRYFNYERSEVKSNNYATVEVASDEGPAAFLQREKLHLSPQEFTRLNNSLMTLANKTFAVITPYSWKSLPAKIRSDFLAAKLRPSSLLRIGLEVSLVVSANDRPNEIAAQLSPSGTYAAALEADIKRHQRPEHEVQIPLQELLPEVVRRWVSRYFDGYGPNCFGLTKAFSLLTPEVEVVADVESLTGALKEEGFVGVEKESPPEWGDVLIYESSSGTGIHSAIYLTQNILLSRNGFSKTYPTVMQEQKVVEAGYFGSEKFRMRVYRRDSALKAKPYDPLYFTEPAHEFIQLGIHPHSFLVTQRRILRSFFTKPLSRLAEDELRRYAADPRFEANSALAHTVLRFQADVGRFRGVCQSIGFFPLYGSMRGNRDALGRLNQKAQLDPIEKEFVEWVSATWPYAYLGPVGELRRRHYPLAPAPNFCFKTLQSAWVWMSLHAPL